MLASGPTTDLNPVYLAQSRLRRRRFDDAIAICTDLLQKNALDQQVWYLKVRATTLKVWIDDTELEEEGAGDLLLEDNALQAAPRPGTSLAWPLTQAGASAAIRPLTQAGRPSSGFARPGTSNRPLTSAARTGTAQQRVATALRGGAPGTARPTTTSGRFVRLGTASLACQPGGPFISVDRLNMDKYAQRKHLARVLCDFLLYSDHNAKAAALLCQAALKHADGSDWWWRLRYGMCYYKLGLLQEATKQYDASLGLSAREETLLHLCKCHMRLDQPVIALRHFEDRVSKSPENVLMLLGAARILEALSNMEASLALYKQALHLDASNVEAMACMASHHFYRDQPEIALRFYRRLLMMGVASAELWNNLGLCCFYASQYDMTLRCFENALLVAGDDVQAEVWYNVSHVAIGLGEKNLAFQALKVTVALNPAHAEALNNLGVLEFQKGNADGALLHYQASQDCAPAAYEPFYNGALSAFKGGELEKAHAKLEVALQNYPEHADSHELLRMISSLFALA